ncbi:hypothetical protein [Pelagibacterium halotolerans]|uniref:hypothetical protein n=1 Tax=Pelagibacterium halotolerans TaxID=531813 RepID=UPI0038500F29
MVLVIGKSEARRAASLSKLARTMQIFVTGALDSLLAAPYLTAILLALLLNEC